MRVEAKRQVSVQRRGHVCCAHCESRSCDRNACVFHQYRAMNRRKVELMDVVTHCRCRRGARFSCIAHTPARVVV